MNLSFGKMIFQLFDLLIDSDQVPDDTCPDQEDDRHYDKQLILGKKFHHFRPHEW
jgi:hypothetical protein